jgi:hypothetical protein
MLPKIASLVIDLLSLSSAFGMAISTFGIGATWS